jgi:DNA-binding transcriptional LysR family regulator
MELRQLEYFVAVAEAANFTRAAERVHISQSGVSAQIRQLERELGAPLIDRSGRTASLTGAGVAALEHARATLAAAEAVRRAVDDVNGLIRGRLVVGMVTACTVTGLFDALAGFRRDHPGVDVALVEDHSDRLVELVRTGAADLALIGAGTAPPQELDSLVIVSERLVAIVPPDHPLAGRKRTTLAEMRAYPLICMPQGTGIRAVFDKACAAQNVEAVIALQASASAAVADLAAHGLGVAVLSESMAAAQQHRLDSLLIEDIEEPALLALVWTASRTPSPALRALLPHCRRAFGEAPLSP